MEEVIRAHEELQKVNEELRHAMHRQRSTKDSRTNPYTIHTQVDPQPFSRAIMEEQVLPHYMVPKIAPFSRSGDS